MRVLLRFTLPLVIVAIVHLTLAISPAGLLIVGLSSLVGFWVMPTVERTLRRWLQARKSRQKKEDSN